jgi:hypothetical protein
VRTFGDQRLTAIATVKNSLLMWHVSGISRFTGITQDDLDIQAGAQGVTSDVGTIAPDSIVVISDQQLGIDAALFVTDRGVYEAHESGILPVSNPIRSVLASLSQADFARVAAAHNRRYFEVLFYIPDVGVYVYNYVLKAWAGPFTGGYKGVITHSMWESQDSEARPIVLVGKADGFVERIDAPGIYRDRVNSDGSGGDLFTFAVRCRRMYAQGLHDGKVVGQVGVHARHESVDDRDAALCDLTGHRHLAAGRHRAGGSVGRGDVGRRHVGRRRQRSAARAGGWPRWLDRPHHRR